MQKSLSYTKGLTTSPSDLLSDDTELSFSQNIIFRDGEMRPIQLPLILDVTLSGIPLVYIHKGADFTNAVCYGEGKITMGSYRASESIIDYEYGDFTLDGATDFTSVGNTLVVTTANGLHYFLFNGKKYADLGTELPIPEVHFGFEYWSSIAEKGDYPCVLTDMITKSDVYAVYDTKGGLNSVADHNVNGSRKFTAYSRVMKSGKVEDFQTAVQGKVAARIARTKEENKFYAPFFVRYALRLFDGSLTRISAPIACFPTVRRNVNFYPAEWNDNNKGYLLTTNATDRFWAEIVSAKLQFRVSIDGIDKWSDIVKELVVFASDDVCPFYLDDDWDFASPMDTDGTAYADYVGQERYTPPTIPGSPVPVVVKAGVYDFSKNYTPYYTIQPKYKSNGTIISELVQKSQFYKLFAIPNDSSYIGSDVLQNAPIQRGVVTNLLQQEQLPVDDYYGWTHKVAQKMFAYNGRLNMTGVKRYPFAGFDTFSCGFSQLGPSSYYTYYVKIVSASTTMWVKNDNRLLTYPDFADGWFYYPDPNATEVVLQEYSTGKMFRIPLKRHPTLNGAYTFNKLPVENTFSSNLDTQPTVTDDTYETLDSQVLTSVVNNPFVFEASGDNTVGTGSILGITANTEAVTQGQFGQYPLIVFTTDGIYALSVSSDGLYSASHPISREVCNNPASVTPTDRLVFFTSDKGLMAVSGGTAVCVSEQMKGGASVRQAQGIAATFAEFVAEAMLAYDYRNSLLFMLRKDTRHAFVYDMKGHTFAHAVMEEKTLGVVSDYPDTLIQYAENSSRCAFVASFGQTPLPANDIGRYSCTFSTRALKLGSSLQLKTIHRMVHLLDSEEGTLSVRLYGSNDCRHWCELKSLHGKPWKYYSMSYSISNMMAADAFAGTVVDFQTVLSDKIR